MHLLRFLLSDSSSRSRMCWNNIRLGTDDAQLAEHQSLLVLCRRDCRNRRVSRKSRCNILYKTNMYDGKSQRLPA